MARGAVLSGVGRQSGSVRLGGTFSPGNSPGTFTVGGDFTAAPDAVLVFEIDGRDYAPAGGAGSYDRLVLTGPEADFTADGTLVPVLRGITGAASNDFTPVDGDSFRIVATENGEGVSGAFAALRQPAEGLPEGYRLDVVYGGDFVDLVVDRFSFETFAEPVGRGNISAAAAAFDRVWTGLEAEDDAAAEDLVLGLYRLEAGDLAAALRQASGEIHASALGALQDGLRSSSEALGAAVSRRTGAGAFWVDASGSWSDYDPTGEASAFDGRTGQLWIGHDLEGIGRGRTGLAFGLSSVDVDTTFGAEAEATTYSMAAYHAASLGNLDIDASAGLAYSEIDTARQVRLSGGTEATDGSGDALAAFASLGANRTHALRPDLDGRAWARLTAVAMNADGYAEDGSAVTGLEVGSEQVRAGLVSAGYGIEGAFDEATWRVDAGLQKGFGGEISRDLSSFGETWAVAAPARDDLAGFASAGIAFSPAENATLSLDAGYAAGERWSSRNVAVTFEMSW